MSYTVPAPPKPNKKIDPGIDIYGCSNKEVAIYVGVNVIGFLTILAIWIWG